MTTHVGAMRKDDTHVSGKVVDIDESLVRPTRQEL
jgi:hypothetical protein